MNSIDELGSPYGYRDSRLSDTQNLIDNREVLMKQWLALLGLDVNEKNELVRREIKIRTDEGVLSYRSKPLMSYEGAIRLIDTLLSPFLSNLASFTTLSRDDVYRVSRTFADNLALWLYSHREEYDIDSRDIESLTSGMADQVFLQLNRSREGNNNLTSQVMGNRTEQYLYRGDNGADEGMNPYDQGRKKSIWNLGGMIGK